MKLNKALLNNLGIKFLALLLALITWIYVSEATKVDEEKTILQKLLGSSNYIAKKLLVKPVFVGNVPEGYEFLKDEIKIDPESIVVVGPSRILAVREYVYTKPIDMSEHTKTKTVDSDLENISRSIDFQKTRVQIYLPVKKIIITEKN